MKPVIDMIRGLLGIRKDLIDTKKSKLEVQKLQDEERSRNLITRASMEDIEKYDPKVKTLKRKINKSADKTFYFKKSHMDEKLLIPIFSFVTVILLLILFFFLSFVVW